MCISSMIIIAVFVHFFNIFLLQNVHFFKTFLGQNVHFFKTFLRENIHFFKILEVFPAFCANFSRFMAFLKRIFV